MRHAPTYPKICYALPCEIDQAKPDRISRLARSTILSKILAAYPPERCRLDRGPSCYAWVSSNLLRSPVSAFDRVCRRFCANPLNLSNFPLRVKRGRFTPEAAQTRCWRKCSSVANLDLPGGESPFSEASHSAKYQRAASKTRSSLQGSRELNSGSCNGLFSAGFPTGVHGCASAYLTRPNEPASHFPHRAGQTATGRLHCPSATVKE
jgi:hypothetical protein